MSRLLLLVEDEQLVQLLLEEALTEAGFELVTADDGSTAMAELEADPDRFQGVITDIKLGNGPDGWAIGHRARELSPEIPVVYTSGDSGHLWTANGVPNSLFIQKPYAVGQVVIAIASLLNDYDKSHPRKP
jgi:DNA-binding NtrC family response regulator